MKIIQKNDFVKAARKLHANQKADLDKAIETIISEPAIGRAKIGDLVGRLVYKFRMNRQVVLLAYTYDEQTDTLSLIKFGDHENFYRDLKRR